MRTLLRFGLLLTVLGLMLGTAQAADAAVAVGAGGWDILGEHTVKPGETLFCIGRAYGGIDPWAIATQNAISRPNLIRPGMDLSIPDVPKTLPAGPVCTPQFGDPPPEPAPPTCGGCTCAWTHVVTWGQTLSWISIHYGVDMHAIAQCNCIYNLNYIRAGQTLCVP